MVPWGLDNAIRATVLEVWGDPPTQVRVRLEAEGADEDEESPVILLSADVLEAA